MYSRIEQLYAQVSQSPQAERKFVPFALKELGVATEELHVAHEELQQQNERSSTVLHEAIARSQYYENLFKHAPEAQLITDQDGKIKEANLSAARLLNIQLESLVGKLLINFIPIDYRTTFRLQLNHLQTSNYLQNWSIILQPRNCDIAEFQVTVSQFTNGDQDNPILHWTLRDTTNTVTAQTLRTARAEPAESAALNHRPVFSYKRREIIPLNPQTLWQVQDGIVKLSSFTEDYEEVLLGLVSPSIPFGIGSMFLPAYQAIAVTDVKLVRFSFQEINQSPELARLFVSQLYQRLQQTEILLNIAGQRRVKDRLYFLLQFLRRELGQPTPEGIRLQIRLVHEDIASACCSTRVTVTRLLSELQKQNKIVVDGNFHIIFKENF
jgi:PAS domain S-box-containing protein